MSYIENINLATNDTGRDAWGRPKVVIDNSIFHGMFTYNVPVTTWFEQINGVTQTSIVNSTSVNGALNIQAGATLNDKTQLRTFRNPRYEPNRGFLYSTAAIIENPTALMTRGFGCATEESGVFFRLKSGGTLVGVVRTTRNSVTTEDEVTLNTSGIDFSKGNVYDIQYQWRGVGNYKFYINLKEVGNSNYLGTLTELSMYNPANPLFFESENLGDNDIMKFGCVDVTSEGGKDNGKTYGSVSVSSDSGEVSLSGFNEPVIAIRSKLTVGGLMNTRDTLALLASGYADNKSILRVWETGDFTAITENSQSWTDYGDGHLEYIVNDGSGVTAMDFDDAKADLMFSCRVPQDSTYSTSALFEGRTEIYLTPGRMFVFTLHRENAGAILGGVTFEFGEEI